MPKQFEVFNMIRENGEKVDCVTMTIGGNDIGFADVVDICAMNNYAKRNREPLDTAIAEARKKWILPQRTLSIKT